MSHVPITHVPITHPDPAQRPGSQFGATADEWSAYNVGVKPVSVAAMREAATDEAYRRVLSEIEKLEGIVDGAMVFVVEFDQHHDEEDSPEMARLKNIVAGLRAARQAVKALIDESIPF